MLGSLIVCSVAAGETFPFIIQDLWHGHQQWVPILISTLSIAIFAEILPQYIIPKNAIDWGYYCCPIIWGCMFLTGILSYPLARLLDALFGKREDHGIFTNDELAALIKYHERSEKHGGLIGQDATRIMLGALHLNSRKIGGDISRISEKSVEGEKDVEKADLIVTYGMIVRWSAVKTIGIDEPVDGTFIKKVKSWSYSRIPVVGVQTENSTEVSSWDREQIFGFLHIKV
jgi:metal transporter CNNM